MYFEGSLVDIAQMQAQLRRLDTEQRAMEDRNGQLEKELKGTLSTLAESGG